MAKQFDVIVIGAGPAGLECARVLKDSNLSVLILEKNETIGPKTCAGGIVGSVESLDLPETKARSFNALSAYIGERYYEFMLADAIKVIDREALGQYQQQPLSNASNVTIKTGEIVRKIENDRVITQTHTFGYRYLVGADGSISLVRRYLKIDSRFMMGIYYDIDMINDHMVFYLDGNRLKTGYIWEFPHQHFTNVGFYYNPAYWKSKNALKMLTNHMSRRGYPKDPKTYRAFPINYLYMGCQFQQNIFLAGDAAGLASKLTGEGISMAMISGREVARKIVNPGYDWKFLEAVVDHKSRQDKLMNMMEKMPLGLNLIYLIVLNALKFRILSWSRFSQTGIS